MCTQTVNRFYLQKLVVNVKTWQFNTLFIINVVQVHGYLRLYEYFLVENIEIIVLFKEILMDICKTFFFLSYAFLHKLMFFYWFPNID